MKMPCKLIRERPILGRPRLQLEISLPSKVFSHDRMDIKAHFGIRGANTLVISEWLKLCF